MRRETRDGNRREQTIREEMEEMKGEDKRKNKDKIRDAKRREEIKVYRRFPEEFVYLSVLLYV
jgi:hypothetical protein